jgi:hypothetical protein
VGAMPRSYQATPAGSARPGAGRKHDGQKRQGRYEPSSRATTRVTLTCGRYRAADTAALAGLGAPAPWSALEALR